MLGYSRLRDWIGADDDSTDTKREYDDSRIEDVDAATDPHAWDDPQRESWRDRIYARRRTLISAGFGLFVVVVLASIYLRRYAFDLLQDPVVREGVKLTTIAVGMYLLGSRQRLQQVRNLDWLVVVEGSDATTGDVTRYVGEFRTVADGGTTATGFVPYSGFSGPLHTPRPLRNRDLGPEMTHAMRSYRSIDPDDPVIIGLGNATLDVVETDTGTIGVTLCSELKPDPEGNATSVYATPPELADQQQLRELRHVLEQVQQERQDLEERLDYYRERAEDLLDELQADRDEHLREFIENVSDLAPAFRGDPVRDEEEDQNVIGEPRGPPFGAQLEEEDRP